MLAVANGVAAAWPQYRGPQASGVDSSKPLPTEWNVATGQNVRWQTPLPGLAHASPIISGERIYVATAVGPGKAELKVGLYGDIDPVEEGGQQRKPVLVAYLGAESRGQGWHGLHQDQGFDLPFLSGSGPDWRSNRKLNEAHRISTTVDMAYLADREHGTPNGPITSATSKGNEFFDDIWSPNHLPYLATGIENPRTIRRVALDRHGKGPCLLYFDGHTAFKKARLITANDWRDRRY